jgi:hypothetical protein
MSNLLDDLFSGAVSRRKFIEIASKAGLALPMANLALAEVAAQTAPKAHEGQKFSPANIGGGGRLERDFYRDWIKTSKAPMVEGYPTSSDTGTRMKRSFLRLTAKDFR